MKLVMMMLFVAACGKGSTGSTQDCAALKPKYIAWHDATVKKVIDEDDPKYKDRDTADAAKESAAAQEKFIGVCNLMKLDETCWVDPVAPAKQADCKTMNRDLEHKMFAGLHE
ncbi:MAG: hypothetical protein QM831_05395 [Kofleriaceae bacterium]